MTRHVVITACGLGLLLATGSCQDDDPAATEVVLAESGACGDVFVWLATAAGEQAAIVQVDARDRSAERLTTIEFSLPDPAVRVQILRGEDLSKNFCTDVIDRASQPSDTQGAVSGAGTITLTPALEDTVACGEGEVTLTLDGLEAEDGTTFAPVDVRSTGIGCYSG
jgi:hypothetical protein